MKFFQRVSVSDIFPVLNTSLKQAVRSESSSACLLGAVLSGVNRTTKVPDDSSEEALGGLDVLEVLDGVEVLDVDGVPMKRD